MDFITTGMFGGTGSEGFHCFMAETSSVVCRVEWVPGEMEKCENPVHGFYVSVCKTVMVST